MHKPVLTTIGLASVGLAVIGIFLPVLPTTPFLLLAIACFARSSEKFHARLLSNKTFGPTIRHWETSKSIPRKAKIYALILIAIAGGTSAVFIENVSLKIALVVLLIIPVLIILNIKTTESL
jgi:uncharacterized membrane protein YbaN (DUF454 family)